ncbi:MAG: hypothetical protein Kow00114_27930 [Kiloniellaceae bacterium]
MTTQTHARQAEKDRAITQPWSVYDKPDDVLADERLSDGEKRRILESWERDARELAVAEEENMGGGEPSQLDSVLQALAKLPAPDERPRGPATMHGSQPTPSSAAPSSTAKTEGGPTLSGGEARQGEIILKTRKRQMIFTAGLVAAAVIGVLGFYAAWPLGG